MRIIDDIVVLPCLGPFGNLKNFHFIVGSGANHLAQAAVYNHFLADETGKGIDPGLFSIYAAVDIHVSAQKADSGPGCIYDGVLLGMNTSAKFIALSMRNFELVP